MRSTITALAATGLALVAAGCEVVPGVEQDTARQLDLIGDVRVEATLCPMLLWSSSPSCESRTLALDAISGGVAESVSQQVLLAYRIPVGTRAPESLPATIEVVPDDYVQGTPVTTEEKAVTFRRSEELAAQMPGYIADLVDAWEDAGNTIPSRPLLRGGEEVVAYVSDVLPGSPVDAFTVTGDFTPPETLAGRPFNRMVMAGLRLANRPGETDPELDPERPLRCLDGADLVTRRPFDTGVDAGCPIPSLMDGSTPDLLGIDLETRGLTVAGGEASGVQGGSVNVPFQLRWHGQAAPESASAIALTGATSLPGATATARDASVRLPEGDNPEAVKVTIPEGAPLGAYEVTLTARIGGQVRTGTALLRVGPKPVSVAPQGSQAQTTDSLFMSRSGTVPFGYICPETLGSACRKSQADILVRAGQLGASASKAKKQRLVRIGRVRFAGKPGTRVRPKIKLGRKVQRLLRRGRSLEGVLVIRSGRNGAPHVRRIVLRRD